MQGFNLSVYRNNLKLFEIEMGLIIILATENFQGIKLMPVENGET